MDIKQINEQLQQFFEEQETYCINLFDAGEGKELDFITCIEGFKSKEEAEEFAKKKYGNRRINIRRKNRSIIYDRIARKYN